MSRIGVLLSLLSLILGTGCGRNSTASYQSSGEVREAYPVPNAKKLKSDDDDYRMILGEWSRPAAEGRNGLKLVFEKERVRFTSFHKTPVSDGSSTSWFPYELAERGNERILVIKKDDYQTGRSQYFVPVPYKLTADRLTLAGENGMELRQGEKFDLKGELNRVKDKK
jgi:hypothetical protein